MKVLHYLPILCFIALGCAAPTEHKPTFEHDITSGPSPWTSDTFELEEDDFTFAIISDLTGGERPNIYGTAVGQLNRLDPTFVLSVGDLIEGGTEDTLQLAKEWDSFDGRTSNLNMPFFHLGGNHDLTNPVMRKFFENRFGRRYYHFVYENVLFLMLDSEDYEEQRMKEIYEARAEALKILDGEIEGVYQESEYYKMEERSIGGMSDDQFEYYKAVLDKYPNVKWTFLLMHKPLWMHEDNKGLERLEALLVDRPYTVFNGHFHSYSHRKRQGRDYIMLGTTGGSQNPADSMAFDEVTLVRMDKEPVITTLKMEGILDETGSVAVVYDSLNQARKDF
ncbi:metallophosphoesterase [Algoriphagus sp. SE2]|uniref:metallophosphoesterase family protein n=1 Tax=Algoriphagus sp. SE2 TaxID=3141536 RepID=UPI0031CD53B4